MPSHPYSATGQVLALTYRDILPYSCKFLTPAWHAFRAGLLSQLEKGGDGRWSNLEDRLHINGQLDRGSIPRKAQERMT